VFVVVPVSGVPTAGQIVVVPAAAPVRVEFVARLTGVVSAVEPAWVAAEGFAVVPFARSCSVLVPLLLTVPELSGAARRNVLLICCKAEKKKKTIPQSCSKNTPPEQKETCNHSTIKLM